MLGFLFVDVNLVISHYADILGCDLDEAVHLFHIFMSFQAPSAVKHLSYSSGNYWLAVLIWVTGCCFLQACIYISCYLSYIYISC
jgi:hypothetical protein